MMSTIQAIGDHGSGPRPQTLQISKSFSRLEPSRSSPLARSRASTLQNGTISESLSPDTEGHLRSGNSPQQKTDVFEKANSSSGRDGAARDSEPLSPQDQEVPEGFDDLPIELISLIDRYKTSRSFWSCIY